MPDFSPFVKREFKINMSNDRNKNFAQANKQLARILSVETEQKWTSKKVTNWMSENNYTWHELNDCKTIQMVPSPISHPVFKHLGQKMKVRTIIGADTYIYEDYINAINLNE